MERKGREQEKEKNRVEEGDRSRKRWKERKGRKKKGDNRIGEKQDEGKREQNVSSKEGKGWKKPVE